MFSTCRWTVPYLASNGGGGGGDCGAVVIVLSRITACKESGPWSQIEK